MNMVFENDHVTVCEEGGVIIVVSKAEKGEVLSAPTIKITPLPDQLVVSAGKDMIWEPTSLPTSQAVVHSKKIPAFLIKHR